MKNFEELATLESTRERILGLEEETAIVGHSDLRGLARDTDWNYYLGLAPEEGTEGVRNLPLDRAGKSGIRSWTSMPFKFLDTIPNPSESQLFEQNVRHAFNTLKDQQLMLLIQKGCIVGIHAGDHPYLSTLDVFDIAAEKLPSARVAYSYFGKYVAIELVTETARTPPEKVGDISHSGLEIQIHDGTPMVSEYVHRLICSNGMTGTDRWVRAKVGSSSRDNMITELHEIIDGILVSSEHLLGHFVESTGQPIQNPEGFVSGLVKREGLPHYMAGEIYQRMSSLPQEGASWYDMINLVTSVANTWREGQHSRVSRLMQLGGRIIRESVRHRCSQCGHDLG